jgi:hypothetical protein
VDADVAAELHHQVTLVEPEPVDGDVDDVAHLPEDQVGLGGDVHVVVEQSRRVHGVPDGHQPAVPAHDHVERVGRLVVLLGLWEEPVRQLVVT